MRELLHIALHATAFDDSDDFHIAATERENPTTKLLFWARRFILTYQAVLVVFLIIFAAQQWLVRRSYRKKRETRSDEAMGRIVAMMSITMSRK